MKKLVVFVFLIFSSWSVAAENPSEKVEVKKGKDGTNVYNFKFYNNGENEKKKDQGSEKKPPLKKKKKIAKDKVDFKKGNGLEGGIFNHRYLGSQGDVSDLNIGLGLKLGFVLMNPKSGTYFTPGVLVAGARAEFDGLGENFIARKYDGSAFGVFFKGGKLFDRGAQLLIDAGVEGSYMTGDLDTDNIFGTGTYKFGSASLSVYGGPVFQVSDFLISTLLNVGASQVTVEESVTSSGLFSRSTSYSENKTVPFYGLSVNATFVF